MSVKRLNLVEELKDKTLELLQESDLPLGVGDIAKRLDVSWTTARAILLTLEAEGKVRSLKTSKSKVYFIVGKFATSQTPKQRGGRHG